MSVVIYENDLGEFRYQPELADGRRLCVIRDQYGSWTDWRWPEGGPRFIDGPKLFASRLRAERIARRQGRRERRETGRAFRERGSQWTDGGTNA